MSKEDFLAQEEVEHRKNYYDLLERVVKRKIRHLFPEINISFFKSVEDIEATHEMVTKQFKKRTLH